MGARPGSSPKTLSSGGSPGGSALRWTAWLTFLGLAVYNSQSVPSPLDWLALAAAIGISIWCMARPLGGPKYELREPTHLLDAFVSRTSWGLVLFGAILTVGGVAGSMAAIYDVSTGRDRRRRDEGHRDLHRGLDRRDDRPDL